MRITKLALALGSVVITASSAMAQGFDGGIPATWTCAGNCGTVAPNGVVSTSPFGGTMMGYVSTNGGVTGGTGAIPGWSYPQPTTDGSLLTSATFTANVNDPLNFYFDYVTSDGSGFPDYAWAALVNVADPTDPVYLFTAATQPTGNTSPGQDLPANASTLSPPTSAIDPGNCVASNYNNGSQCTGAQWSPLGGYSGQCYAAGCGSTGWIQSTYDITEAGTYELEFGVVNARDQLFDSGLAIDGLTVNGSDIVSTPEPASLVLFATGLLGLAPMARRRSRKA